MDGMEKFKEALRMCEEQLKEEEEEEKKLLGKEEYERKKREEMEQFLKEEAELDKMELFLKRKARLHKHYHFFIKNKKKKAIILLFFISILFLIKEKGEAIYSPFLRLIEEKEEQASRLRVNEIYYNSEEKLEEIKLETLYKLTYLPEGYQLKIEKVRNHFQLLIYENESSKIKFYQSSISNYNKINTEHVEGQIEEYKGKEYYYLPINKVNSNIEDVIIWTNSQYQFQLFGLLPLEELLKIADSIEEVEE